MLSFFVIHASAESHHPSDLAGIAFGTDCYWGIGEDSCLWIWADFGSGVLPVNMSDRDSFWPWYDVRRSINSIVIEFGVSGLSGSLGYMFSSCLNIVVMRGS